MDKDCNRSRTGVEAVGRLTAGRNARPSGWVVGIRFRASIATPRSERPGPLSAAQSTHRSRRNALSSVDDQAATTPQQRPGSDDPSDDPGNDRTIVLRPGLNVIHLVATDGVTSSRRSYRRYEHFTCEAARNIFAEPQSVALVRQRELAYSLAPPVLATNPVHRRSIWRNSSSSDTPVV